MTECVFVEELTSREIGNRISSGYTTVIVPLGAIEQHGPALPLLVDCEHGLQTAVRAAYLLGKTLVGPVVTLGCSSEHSHFPGTVSLSDATLSSIIHDVAESHVRTGFRLIYFWIAHGGSNAVLQDSLPTLRTKWPGHLVIGIRDLDHYTSQTWGKIPLEKGVSLQEAGSHAGEFETSMMLAAKPNLVRMSEAEVGNTEPFHTIAERMMTEGIHTVSLNGVLGDQRTANAERGEFYLNKLAEYLAWDLKDQQRALCS